MITPSQTTVHGVRDIVIERRELAGNASYYLITLTDRDGDKVHGVTVYTDGAVPRIVLPASWNDWRTDGTDYCRACGRYTPNPCPSTPVDRTAETDLKEDR